ncbi:UDP-glucoronosyl and UDP-glucosyl transferase superfamily [Synechococcus sp. PCC 7335]|uniref:glycosyltransferase n=1 Tax=Synechococcus sp. (strain ATCC 29403 / PCC 7335) TaxID=91464 RepID=UPI00017EB197|nr:glycosyltransferase [Synechococcus sp. PCC 7335]EDX82834.1 UDP-glucoronosyl and UDP-glucosyl transferase superfamily [Synechococcus sp. PCC 7335]
MSRIVLTTWGSLGDLHPMLALSLELRDRGHHIILATAESYRNQIESLELEFYAIRPDLPEDPQTISKIIDPKTGSEAVLKEIVLGSVRDTYDDLMAIAQAADLLIAHEIVYAAPLVAEVLKLPWASCTLAPAAFFSAYEPIVISGYPALSKLHRFGPKVNRLAVNSAKLTTHPWGDPIYQLCKELRLQPIQNPIVGNDKYSPHLVLALFSSLLGTLKPDWPPNVVTTGFTFYDGNSAQPISPELEDFLNSAEPPLVFTLGSAAVNAPGDFYAASAWAAINLNRRAVLLLGQNPPPQNLPASIFACDYAPYSKIFPRACAMVHQGGIGTTAQALRAGRPTLIMPYSLDQPDNAARVQRLGTSRTLSRKNFSASQLTEELRTLLDTLGYATKAAEIGRIISLEKGVDVACNAIENQIKES